MKNLDQMSTTLSSAHALPHHAEVLRVTGISEMTGISSLLSSVRDW